MKQYLNSDSPERNEVLTVRSSVMPRRLLETPDFNYSKTIELGIKTKE